MRTSSSGIVFLAWMILAGCSLLRTNESMYLNQARNQATQEEVRRALGDPLFVSATSRGEPVWVYEVREIEPMSQSTWSTEGSWCDTYTLFFDQQGILRDVQHQSFVHGGELMPVSCNSAIGVEKPAL